MRYLYVSVNVAAILENGGYRRSATNGQLAPSKILHIDTIPKTSHTLLPLKSPRKYILLHALPLLGRQRNSIHFIS